MHTCMEHHTFRVERAEARLAQRASAGQHFLFGKPPKTGHNLCVNFNGNPLKKDRRQMMWRRPWRINRTAEPLSKQLASKQRCQLGRDVDVYIPLGSQV